MKLATIDPQRLGAWLAKTLRYPGAPVELHVNPHGWEFRCADVDPLLVDPSPEVIERALRRGVKGDR